MSIILLDTTVASLLHPKKKSNISRVDYEVHMIGNILALSFQSIAELWAWAEENNWGDKQKLGLEIFLKSFLMFLMMQT